MDVNYIIYDLDYALEKQCINLINELKSVHLIIYKVLKRNLM